MERRYKYVAVIGIDGMGAFCNNTPTPNFDRIFENGCQTTRALSMTPTISAQNWGAMLVGAQPAVHKVTNESIGQQRYSNNLLPSVFKRIRDHYPDALICSYANWGVINHGLIEENLDVHTYSHKDDEILTEKICECIKDKPDFLFVQLDNVDHAGHEYGYGKSGHLERITKTDEFVGKIYDEYCKWGLIDDTLFVVITDHGGIRNGHGGYSDEEKYIFFGVSGRTVIKGSNPLFLQTRDIAAIVLYGFGIDIPDYKKNGFSSQIPEGVFSDYSKKYFKINALPNIPETKPTPIIDGKNGLYSFFEKDEVCLYVDFDNTTEDKTGNYQVCELGTVKYYSNGVRGSYAELGAAGFSKFENLVLNKTGFSVAFWVKMNKSLEVPTTIFSHEQWWHSDRQKSGFCAALQDTYISLHVICGDSNFENFAPFPENVSEGWVHTVISFDKRKGEVRIYYNFSTVWSFEVDDVFFENIDTLPFTIGSNASFQKDNIVLVDEFIVFKKPLEKDEVKKLEEYYS